MDKKKKAMGLMIALGKPDEDDSDEGSEGALDDASDAILEAVKANDGFS
jgi:hypothetical protein